MLSSFLSFCRLLKSDSSLAIVICAFSIFGLLFGGGYLKGKADGAAEPTRKLAELRTQIRESQLVQEAVDEAFRQRVSELEKDLGDKNEQIKRMAASNGRTVDGLRRKLAAASAKLSAPGGADSQARYEQLVERIGDLAQFASDCAGQRDQLAEQLDAVLKAYRAAGGK